MENLLNKAKENFEAAQLCYDSNLYNAYGNRIYYAFYQLGCYLRKSIEYKKNPHKALIKDVKDCGDRDLAIQLQRLKGMRVKSDYTLEDIKESDVQMIKQKTDLNFNNIHKRLKGV